MSEISRDLNLTGIILKKTLFRETSLILDVFTREMGLIAVLAKGVRQEKSKSTGLLEILNELDLSLYKNPGSEWFLFKNAELLNAHLLDANFQTGILMQAAAEIYKQLIFEQNDFEELYQLLTQYLKYIRPIPKNGIAIFWRFLLRLFRLIGIEFDVSRCGQCGRKDHFSGYFPRRHGFICVYCYRPEMESYLIKLNSEEAKIFANLQKIGNLLNDLNISSTTIQQVNRIFLMHLSEHFQQKFHLKSLELLA